jgi:uncharacterized membrane protein
MEQAHVEFFTVFFVALALYAALEDRRKLLVVAVIAVLLCKEDTALITVPLALWVMWRRDPKFGAKLVGLSLVLAAAANGFIRAVLGQLSVHGGRFPFGGFNGMLLSPFAHPGKLYHYVTRDKRPFYVWQMVFSAGLAGLWAPEVAAIGVLVLASNVMSTFGYQHEIQYHYSMPLVPILAFGSVYGVSKLKNADLRWVAAGLIAIMAATACTLWGLAPFSNHTYPYLSTSDPEVVDINRVVAQVPTHAVITAFYPYVAHIDHRTRIYQFPVPFEAQYWNTFKQEGQRLSFVDQIQYVMIPTNLDGQLAGIWAGVSSGFHVVAQSGDVALFEKNAPKNAAQNASKS